MKALKYTILALFILNLPGATLVFVSPTLSSIMSYASFLLMFIYYVFYLRGKPNLWLVYIGLSYFLISGFQTYVAITFLDYIILIIKYLIIVVCGNSFFKNNSQKEMLYILSIGAISIIINAAFFPDKLGRYSGFYLNPNAAGFICLIGYALCFKTEKSKLTTLFQILFTIAGLLTFSRTFILVWLIINLFAIRINVKNIRILGIGFGLGLALLVFGELLNIGGLRFKQYQSVFENKASASTLEEGSRTETWALFYEEIYKNPVFGGGYGKFQGGGIMGLGPHNTYLLIIGEAGIIPFLFFLCFILYILYWSNKLFKSDPTSFLMAITLAFYLLASHTFFGEYVKLSITLFIFNQVANLKEATVAALLNKKLKLQ